MTTKIVSLVAPIFVQSKSKETKAQEYGFNRPVSWKPMEHL